MSKNIVIFSDGTGAEGGEGYNTNVYKLFNMVEDRTPRQVAFYDPGLGTDGRKILGMIGGRGFSKNVCQCYRYIFENFEAGDQLFLLGFSRGAATVRSLSSFIHYFGILPRSRPDLIKKGYEIYKVNDDNQRKKKAKEFVRRHHTMWARVKFLGCYDTVAALGLPSKPASVIINSIPPWRHRFHNFTLSESVEHACQALAIDDERKAFLPVLWETETEPYQTIDQVWFAGNHSDIGGGYEDQTLSDIPLVWLTQKAVSYGLLIYHRHKVKISEDANGPMHDARGSFITKFYPRKIRSWSPGRKDKPVIHQSVLERTRNNKNQSTPPYHPWILDLDYKVEPWMHYEAQNS